MRVLTPAAKKALTRAQKIENYDHKVVETATTTYFIMEDPRAAAAVLRILNAVLRGPRPALIHNGGKPRARNK